jgi:hypothetical protein
MKNDAIGEARARSFYESDPVFSRLQWEIRNAFEEVWRMAGAIQ